jgi:hypothetical protein
MTQASTSDWVWFVMGIAGFLIISLGSMCVWFMVQRSKMRDRESETLERRLSNGAETMQRMVVRLEQVEGKQTLHGSVHLSTQDFDEFCKAHFVEHKEINSTVLSIRESVSELKTTINAIGNRVEDAVKSIPRMLGQIVELRNPEK